MLMKIATWNINGIRARVQRVNEWIDKVQPEVLCLQETKTVDQTFPFELFEEHGYHIEVWGQKAYNGVAVASRQPFEYVQRGFGDGVEDSQARFVAVQTFGLTLASVYVPNGKEVGCDKYEYKLQWLERLKRWVAHHRASRAGQAMVLCGDFNVAPAPEDTHDPEGWEGRIMCSEAEREALAGVSAEGLHDALRHVHPNEKVFTWWDYRAAAFRRNMGLRIDHFFVSRNVLERVRDVWVDREERKQTKPSDHAPVVMELK